MRKFSFNFNMSRHAYFVERRRGYVVYNIILQRFFLFEDLDQVQSISVGIVTCGSTV